MEWHCFAYSFTVFCFCISYTIIWPVNSHSLIYYIIFKYLLTLTYSFITPSSIYPLFTYIISFNYLCLSFVITITSGSFNMYFLLISIYSLPFRILIFSLLIHLFSYSTIEFVCLIKNCFCYILYSHFLMSNYPSLILHSIF